MVRDKDKFSILFLCIHKRLDDKVGISRVITKNNVNIILGSIYHIPKPMRLKVINELIDRKIIVESGGKEFIVLPFTSNLFDF